MAISYARIEIAGLFLLVMLACSSAVARECEPSTSTPLVDTGTPDAARFYLAVECPLGPCVAAVWLYAESNGHGGLQRQDDHHDDTCGGLIEPDTLIPARDLRFPL